MNFELKEVLSLAKTEYELNNHKEMTPLHLLMGVLIQPNGIGWKIFHLLGANIDQMIYSINEHFSLENNLIKIRNTNDIKTGEGVKEILREMYIESEKLGVDMSVELLLKTFYSFENDAKEVLLDFKLTYKGICDKLKLDRSTIEKEYQEIEAKKNLFIMRVNDFEEPSFSVRKNKKNETPILKSFGVNLNELAEQGKIQEVIGRGKEIERMMVVLMRKSKRNPLIIGDPGVGKSALVEGLALKIIKGDVHDYFKNKIVYTIDLASMVAGTKFRGEFEERLKGLIKELKDNPNVIIFLDEMHQLIGAGSTQGTMDGANMIKPELSRGDIQVIGATTYKEYKEHIQNDGAITRRFQNINIVEPTVNETVEIINGIKYKYEEYHNVVITEEMVTNAVLLADKYITSRKFPDKAIDIIDELCAFTNFNNVDMENDYTEIKEKINSLKKEEDDANEMMKRYVKSSDFEKAANIRDKKHKITIKISEVENELAKLYSSRKTNSVAVEPTEDDLLKTVSLMTGVKIDKLDENNIDYLLRLEEKLNKKVIGQKDAVETMCQGIIRQKTGIKDPNKPLVYLFLGQTGVGKTKLVKEIAKEVYGSDSNFIRVNMSDYQDSYTVSNLTGSAKGYVGSETGSYLYEKVKHNPSSIILLDEVEKAHPNVFNAFLQIFDEGQAVTNEGEIISFKETIIVMTSNLGVREANASQKNLSMVSVGGMNESRMKNAYDNALKQKFAPEILNRITKIITFNNLQKENTIEIAKIELNNLKKRVEANGKELHVTQKALEFLSETGFSLEYGARFLNRTIEQEIEIPLSYFILTHQKKNKITVDFKDDKITFK